MTLDKHKQQVIDGFRASMRDVTQMLKNIVEHPEILDDWTPTQRAWLMEHLELNMQEMKKLQANIEEVKKNK